MCPCTVSVADLPATHPIQSILRPACDKYRLLYTLLYELGCIQDLMYVRTSVITMLDYKRCLYMLTFSVAK